MYFHISHIPESGEQVHSYIQLFSIYTTVSEVCVLSAADFSRTWENPVYLISCNLNLGSVLVRVSL